MPAFSRFYSVTEAEAAANLLRFFPQIPEGALNFSSDDAERLEQLVKSTITLEPRSRKDINQPLFRSKPSVKPVEQLNASVFTVISETVYRDKPVHYESTSDESQAWKTRSRTPSSDEPSPQNYRLPSPTLSAKVEASSISGGSDDGLTQTFKPAQRTHMKTWRPHSQHRAIYPQNILQTMDTQFSKWSYDLNEGTTAIPFVMAQAPPETHGRLVGIDRRLWVTGSEDADGDFTDSQATAKALLERIQRKTTKRTDSSRALQTSVPSSFYKSDFSPEDDPFSKRAAFIARGKAAKDSSLVASKSVGQRRSALQKNKNRRSIMPSPTKKPELARKSETQAEQSKPTIIVLNSKEDEQRRGINSDLQNRRIDFENKRTLEALMEQLGSPKADTGRDQVIEEVHEIDRNEHGAEQTGRLKGKARKRGKSNAAR